MLIMTKLLPISSFYHPHMLNWVFVTCSCHIVVEGRYNLT